MLRYIVLLLSFVSLLFANIPHNDTYNLAGNLITKTIDGISTSYGYNENDQLVQQGSVTYTYDANGNLIDDGTDTYEYDDKNRLVKVTTPNGIIEYEYTVSEVQRALKHSREHLCFQTQYCRSEFPVKSQPLQ